MAGKRWVWTLAVTIMACAPAQSQDYAGRFNHMDDLLNNGQGLASSSNASGTLAWGQSYVQCAYVDMYRATGKTRYLDKLVEQFTQVLKSRDDVLRKPGFYRGKPLAGWGSDTYSKGKWHVWAVHTGMICQGPMEFVRLVRARLRLRRAYSAAADTFLVRIRESVAAHDPEWRDGPGPDEGYYEDPIVGPLPLNQQNALGVVELDLYLVTRDHVYKDRVERLAHYFKNRLRTTPGGAYEWSYWPKPRQAGTGTEDISHAAINVRFAARCKDAHLVFNDQDMRAFAKTWTDRIRRADGEWADTVGGAGGPNTFMPTALGGWLPLCRYDRRILDDAKFELTALDADATGGSLMAVVAVTAYWQTQISRGKGKGKPAANETETPDE